MPTPPTPLAPATAPADGGGEGGAEIQAGGLESIFSVSFDSVVE